MCALLALSLSPNYDFLVGLDIPHPSVSPVPSMYDSRISVCE